MQPNTPPKIGRPPMKYKKNKTLTLRMHEETYIMIKELAHIYEENSPQKLSACELIEQLIRDEWRKQLYSDYND
ncbi:MAG: hypothetical protein K6G10_06220 [Butyrivibrio sp.]|nr:hypothetical protein [Butyrivibrio sp.]